MRSSIYIMSVTATSSNIFENGSNIDVKGVLNFGFGHDNPFTIFINQLKKKFVDSREETQQTANAHQLELRGVQYI